MKPKVIATAAAVLTAAVVFLAPNAIAKYGTAPADAGASGLHDDGLLWLKVWNTGWVGGQREGSGIYPAPHGPANLYHGEFWMGAIKEGELYFNSPGSGWHALTEVIMSYEPEWAQVPPYIKREGTLDSYYRMDDADAGEKGPIPVTCDVHGMSWSLPEYDDFIGLRFYVENGAATTLEDVYFALVYDFDVGGSLSYIDDYVGFDETRLMPYMYDDDLSHPYIGLICVDKPAHAARSWDIPNYPDTGLAKYYYMTAPGFDCEQTQPYDWRVLLSVGPFEILPHTTQKLTFALVAGTDLEHLQENADAAVEGFRSEAPPKSNKPAAFNLAQNRPNPVTTATRITFACRASARVKLAVYDLAGRRVALLADDIYPPGTHDVKWAPEGVPPGVYIYALEAAGERFAKTMVVAR